MNRTLDLTKGNIWKKLLLFCFPIMLGTLFQQLYTAVTTFVCYAIKMKKFDKFTDC